MNHPALAESKLALSPFGDRQLRALETVALIAKDFRPEPVVEKVQTRSDPSLPDLLDFKLHPRPPRRFLWSDEAGCALTYRETASGAKSDRKQLRRMLQELQRGDIVTVTRIDRLARSIFDLFCIVKNITDAGAQFRSLAEPPVDTNTSTGRMMLAVLGGMADIERDLIKTRTAEGRSRAKARGKSLGRPFKLTLAQRDEIRERLANGKPLKEIAHLQCQSANDLKVTAVRGIYLTRRELSYNVARFYRMFIAPNL